LGPPAWLDFDETNWISFQSIPLSPLPRPLSFKNSRSNTSCKMLTWDHVFGIERNSETPSSHPLLKSSSSSMMTLLKYRNAKRLSSLVTSPISPVVDDVRNMKLEDSQQRFNQLSEEYEEVERDLEQRKRHIEHVRSQLYSSTYIVECEWI
jgi:hypothetical protein